MSFEINNIDQFSNIIDAQFFYPFYEKLSQISEDQPYLFIASPLIGMIDGTASLIQAGGTVGESAIKGFCNLVKAAASCDGLALRVGAIQWGLGVVGIGVAALPISVSRSIRITWGMAVDPVATSKKQWENFQSKVAMPAESII